MSGSVSFIVAVVAWVIGILILGLCTISYYKLRKKMKGGQFVTLALIIMIVAILFMFHALVEVLGLNELFYSISAVVASLILLGLVLKVRGIIKTLEGI